MLPAPLAGINDGFEPERRYAILRAQELAVFMSGAGMLLGKTETDDKTVAALVAGVNDLYLHANDHKNPQLLARVRLVDVVELVASMEALDRDGARVWSRDGSVETVRRALHTRHPEVEPRLSNKSIAHAIAACRGFQIPKWAALLTLCIEAGLLPKRAKAGTLKREHARWKQRTQPVLSVRLG